MKSEKSPLVKELKRNKQIELPMDAEFYDRLHDKIMASIEQTTIHKPSIWEKRRERLRAHWKSWTVSGGSLLLVLFAATQSPIWVDSVVENSHTVQVVRNEEEFNFESSAAPEEFAETLITYQSHSDFFVDVAERSFHDLSLEHVREIMGEAGL